ALLEDLELVSVGDGADAVGDGGEAVAEDGLLGDDVDVLGFAVRMETAAAGGAKEPAEDRSHEQPLERRALSGGGRVQARMGRHGGAGFLGGMKDASGANSAGPSGLGQGSQESWAMCQCLRW